MRDQCNLDIKRMECWAELFACELARSHHISTTEREFLSKHFCFSHSTRNVQTTLINNDTNDKISIILERQQIFQAK
jgi:hypothetical protein